jgi:hypothetical protein
VLQQALQLLWPVVLHVYHLVSAGLVGKWIGVCV